MGKIEESPGYKAMYKDPDAHRERILPPYAVNRRGEVIVVAGERHCRWNDDKGPCTDRTVRTLACHVRMHIQRAHGVTVEHQQRGRPDADSLKKAGEFFQQMSLGQIPDAEDHPSTPESMKGREARDRLLLVPRKDDGSID